MFCTVAELILKFSLMHYAIAQPCSSAYILYTSSSALQRRQHKSSEFHPRATNQSFDPFTALWYYPDVALGYNLAYAYLPCTLVY